jgi:hypothetical protein
MNWGVIIVGILIAAFSVLLYQSGGPSKGPGLLIAIAVLVVMDVAIYLGERGQRNRLARLGAAFDEGTARLRVGLFTRRRVEGQFRGRAARLRLQPGIRGQPGCVVVELACSSAFRFTFWKAARIRVGKARDGFLLNDPELDREFSLVSDEPDRARSWFLTPDIKGKVVALLRGAYGWSLAWKQGFLSCEMYGLDRMQEGKALRRAVESGPTSGHFGHRIPTIPTSEIDALIQAEIRGVLDCLTQLAVSLERLG